METKSTMWTNEEVNFILQNKELTITELAKSLNRTYSSVKNKRNKLGLKNENKYTYDSKFFENPLNEKSAYWLGFLYADGYIRESNRTHEIGIELKRSDFEHLKKFNKDIGGNYPIRFRKRTATFGRDDYSKEFELCNIRIYSNKLGEDLINLGMIPNKSKIIEFPTLKECLLLPFIRGFFDGDGSVFIKYKSLCCNFTSGSKNFIESLSVILDRYNIEHKVINYDTPSIYYQIVISNKKQVKTFLGLIYDNPSVYLDRKYKFYIENKHLLELPQ